MILGTVSYMSPEQARGKPADYRSDQFSFGLILYEMAAGRKAFDKPESVQTMSAILTEDPPPIERNIPAPLRWTIDRCLAKDPADRYESTRDLFQELRQYSRSRGRDDRASRRPRRPRAREVAAAGALGVSGNRHNRPDRRAFALGRYLAPVRGSPTNRRIVSRPSLSIPAGQSGPVWSPDGKAVAYAGRA